MQPSLHLAEAGDIALLVGQDRKDFLIRLEPGEEFQTHLGVVKHDELLKSGWGASLATHLGKTIYLLKPTLRDILLQIPRRSQILFPKDIGYILLRLAVLPSQSVTEVGVGSGALTTALAWAVGIHGQVISYERRQDMLEMAENNLKRVGLEQRVNFHHADIEDGLEGPASDSLFLDIPNPEIYLEQIMAAVKPGGVLGAFLPTTNQVSALLQGLERHSITMVDVCEILLRFYKTVPARLRPSDRMVAHTGYLVFARPLQTEVDLDGAT